MFEANLDTDGTLRFWNEDTHNMLVTLQHVADTFHADETDVPAGTEFGSPNFVVRLVSEEDGDFWVAYNTETEEEVTQIDASNDTTDVVRLLGAEFAS